MRKKDYQDQLEVVILQKDDMIATLIAERDMWKGKY